MKTVEELYLYYKKLEIEVCPYSKEEIDVAIEKCGTLPKILINYFEIIGSIFENNQVVMQEFPIDIDGPYWLHETVTGKGNDEKDEYIKIASDIYGTIEFVIRKSDSNEENPEIYLSSDWIDVNKVDRK
ncbi:hypothetical protein [Listeria seeligeri]|uniref:hypothetical protein n=1 Tax=Listeria seeligeri TaxID=1640 RepID=UPI0022EBB3A7|nr:hypothetical protein [Listeria seeligeri]